MVLRLVPLCFTLQFLHCSQAHWCYTISHCLTMSPEPHCVQQRVLQSESTRVGCVFLPSSLMTVEADINMHIFYH